MKIKKILAVKKANNVIDHLIKIGLKFNETNISFLTKEELGEEALEDVLFFASRQKRKTIFSIEIMNNVLSWIKQSNTKENPLLRLSPVRPHEFSGNFVTASLIPLSKLNKLNTNNIFIFQIENDKTKEINLVKDLKKVPANLSENFTTHSFITWNLEFFNLSLFFD